MDTPGMVGGRDPRTDRPLIYVASPYGFSESTRAFLYQQFYPAIRAAGVEIFDPWADPLPDLLAMGARNAEAIRLCTGVVAGLDGQEMDSGTVGEVGFAAGLGRWIVGYRSDLRRAGDGEGVVINLQVEYFVRGSGGMLVSTLDAVTQAVRERVVRRSAEEGR